MKKVLILAYDFPPYVSVGGLRPYNWYKYFNEFGVYPIVVTRQWTNEYGNELDYVAPSISDKTEIEETERGMIIRSHYQPNLSNRLLLKYGKSKYKFFRKLITAFYEFAQFVIPVGPKKELYRSANTYLKENSVDAIIATGDPFILFKYASKLSQKYTTPWIADYRDPWSQDIYGQQHFLLNRWGRIMEKRIVRKATLFTTVDNFFAYNISKLVPNLDHKIVPNGFDPEAIERVKNIEQETDVLTISFIGTLYNWHPINSFLRVFEEFVNSNPDDPIRLKFYGLGSNDMLTDLIASTYKGIEDKIVIYPRIPNPELLEAISKDNVMLLFNYYSFMGTKIFDYIGINRKILFCYSNDKEAQRIKDQYYTLEEDPLNEVQIQIALINKTNSGIIIENDTHLLFALKQLAHEFKSSGKIECNSIGVDKLSRKKQVELLAQIITGIKSKS